MSDFDSWLDGLTQHIKAKGLRQHPAGEDFCPEEGDPCPFCGTGAYEIKQDTCYCGAVPAPCSPCEDAWLECTDCCEQVHPKPWKNLYHEKANQT